MISSRINLSYHANSPNIKLRQDMIESLILYCTSNVRSYNISYTQIAIYKPVTSFRPVFRKNIGVIYHSSFYTWGLLQDFLNYVIQYISYITNFNIFLTHNHINRSNHILLM
jgi:hypothetical protein